MRIYINIFFEIFKTLLDFLLVLLTRIRLKQETRHSYDKRY